MFNLKYRHELEAYCDPVRCAGNQEQAIPKEAKKLDQRDWLWIKS